VGCHAVDLNNDVALHNTDTAAATRLLQLLLLKPLPLGDWLGGRQIGAITWTMLVLHKQDRVAQLLDYKDFSVQAISEHTTTLRGCHKHTGLRV
jgi:hypothetical protein